MNRFLYVKYIEMKKILIAGGSGLVGQRLSELLTKKGYSVAHLSRSPKQNAPYPSYKWDVNQQTIDDQAMDNVSVIINLAGAGIADNRWTDNRKKLIIESRVKGAQTLKSAIQKAVQKPVLYLSAAAVGYYGNRGEELVTEESPSGDGFLAESCIAWEQAARDVANTGIRTVWIRIGIVLSTKGGALEKMLLPSKLGIGTYFGDGKQYYAWIHIDDICHQFIHAIENESLSGVYNGVAPKPVSNKAFAKTLLKALNRPQIAFPAPAFAMRLALGEMADVVLTGANVASAKIQETGFEFEHPELLEALKDVVKRKI